MKVIKLFGLPRTCTNLVTVLLKKNFQVLVLINFPDWKHGKLEYQKRKIRHRWNDLPDKKRSQKLKSITDDNDYLYFAICLKDPYRWLVSYYEHIKKRGGYKKVSFDELIQGVKSYYYDQNILDVYNDLIEHWYSIHNMEGVLTVMAEDLVSEKGQLSFLKHFQSALGLSQLNAEYKTEVKDVLQGKRNLSVPVADRSVYRQRNIVPYYNKELVDMINSKLNEDLVNISGYRLMDYDELVQRDA